MSVGCPVFLFLPLLSPRFPPSLASRFLAARLSSSWAPRLLACRMGCAAAAALPACLALASPARGPWASRPPPSLAFPCPFPSPSLGVCFRRPGFSGLFAGPCCRLSFYGRGAPLLAAAPPFFPAALWVPPQRLWPLCVPPLPRTPQRSFCSFLPVLATAVAPSAPPALSFRSFPRLRATTFSCAAGPCPQPALSLSFSSLPVSPRVCSLPLCFALVTSSLCFVRFPPSPCCLAFCRSLPARSRFLARFRPVAGALSPLAPFLCHLCPTLSRFFCALSSAARGARPFRRCSPGLLLWLLLALAFVCLGGPPLVPPFPVLAPLFFFPATPDRSRFPFFPSCRAPLPSLPSLLCGGPAFLVAPLPAFPLSPPSPPLAGAGPAARLCCCLLRRAAGLSFPTPVFAPSSPLAPVRPVSRASPLPPLIPAGRRCRLPRPPLSGPPPPPLGCLPPPWGPVGAVAFASFWPLAALPLRRPAPPPALVRVGPLPFLGLGCFCTPLPPCGAVLSPWYPAAPFRSLCRCPPLSPPSLPSPGLSLGSRLALRLCLPPSLSSWLLAVSPACCPPGVLLLYPLSLSSGLFPCPLLCSRSPRARFGLSRLALLFPLSFLSAFLRALLLASLCPLSYFLRHFRTAPLPPLPLLSRLRSPSFFPFCPPPCFFPRRLCGVFPPLLLPVFPPAFVRPWLSCPLAPRTHGLIPSSPFPLFLPLLPPPSSPLSVPCGFLCCFFPCPSFALPFSASSPFSGPPPRPAGFPFARPLCPSFSFFRPSFFSLLSSRSPLFPCFYLWPCRPPLAGAPPRVLSRPPSLGAVSTWMGLLPFFRPAFLSSLPFLRPFFLLLCGLFLSCCTWASLSLFLFPFRPAPRLPPPASHSSCRSPPSRVALLPLPFGLRCLFPRYCGPPPPVRFLPLFSVLYLPPLFFVLLASLPSSFCLCPSAPLPCFARPASCFPPLSVALAPLSFGLPPSRPYPAPPLLPFARCLFPPLFPVTSFVPFVVSPSCISRPSPRLPPSTRVLNSSPISLALLVPAGDVCATCRQVRPPFLAFVLPLPFRFWLPSCFPSCLRSCVGGVSSLVAFFSALFRALLHCDVSGPPPSSLPFVPPTRSCSRGPPSLYFFSRRACFWPPGLFGSFRLGSSPRPRPSGWTSGAVAYVVFPCAPFFFFGRGPPSCRRLARRLS